MARSSLNSTERIAHQVVKVMFNRYTAAGAVHRICAAVGGRFATSLSLPKVSSSACVGLKYLALKASGRLNWGPNSTVMNAANNASANFYYANGWTHSSIRCVTFGSGRLLISSPLTPRQSPSSPCKRTNERYNDGKASRRRRTDRPVEISSAIHEQNDRPSIQLCRRNDGNLPAIVCRLGCQREIPSDEHACGVLSLSPWQCSEGRFTPMRAFSLHYASSRQAAACTGI